jgi:drug/metabolite transporter (DMT)-like permease
VGIAMRFSVAAMATLPWLLLSSSSSSSSRTSDSDTNIILSDNGRPQSEESWNEFKIPSEMLGPMVGGAEVGFWNTLGFLGQAMGLQTSLASTSAFICSLAVVTVPLYDFLAGKKIFSRSIIGAILAVMGVALLEVGDLLLEEGGGSVVGAGVQEDGFMPSTGTLYSLIQPIAFGMGFWRLEYWTRKYPGAEGGLKLTAAHMMTIASLMVCCVLIFHSNDVYHIQEWIRNPTVLGAILWTGIVTTAIPSFFETKALKSLTAAETTMLYSTEPIFGSIFAAAVLGESMGLGGGIGALMVVFGCLYSSLGPSGETQQTS